MKNLKSYHFAIVAIALLWSCQKEENAQRREKSEVQFFAYYNETPFTKAPPAFKVGNKASIYAYSAGANPTSATFTSGTPVEATVLTEGTLTPEPLLYLPKGTYDFYSVSLNSKTAPGLTFAAGYSGQLTNDKDYLWASASSISEGGSVSFQYQHKAVGIEIAVSAGDGVSNLSVTSIKITPSKPTASSKMELKTGNISASSEKDVFSELILNGNKGEKIMLPLTSLPLDVEVILNATIGGTPVSNKKYIATLPARAYEAGKYYKFALTAGATVISFGGATLIDWTNETIASSPLTEQ